MGNCLASNNNKTNNTLDKSPQPQHVSAEIPIVLVQPEEPVKDIKGSMAVSIGLTGSSMAKEINDGLEQQNPLQENPIIVETSSQILGQEQKESSEDDSIAAIKINPKNTQAGKAQPESPQQIIYSEIQKKDIDDILAQAQSEGRVDETPRLRPSIQQSAVFINLDIKEAVHQREVDPLAIIDIS